MAKIRRRTRKKRTEPSRCQVKRIDILPDDVLLEIFGFYMIMKPSNKKKSRVSETWQSLVHVCRRWRNLVFASPRGLNLQLHCTPETPARDKLDVWPALPLIVSGNTTYLGTDNIIAALGQSNRVRQIDLDLADWQTEEVLAPMQVPFPELTDLWLFSDYETPVIPDSFLGGSAPRLQIFVLHDIPFPGLPKLLLSATHLVHLRLFSIPDSGYISPEAMVALLSVLSSLERLILQFQSPQSRPDRESRSLPPPKRSLLPALDEFHFEGDTEYLEELVTRIDTPQLDEVHITFFKQFVDFDCPRLAQFIIRTPTFRARYKARVQFDVGSASIEFPARSGSGTLEIGILCEELDLQLSTLAQVCNSLPPPSTVEVLYIEHQYLDLDWEDDAVENTLWLELLLPFTAVKTLYLCEDFAPGIEAALQESVGASETEVLPDLQNILVE